MSEINKFKELLHQHTQVSFSCGEHRVPREYAKFEAKQRETERALVEWVEKREARIEDLLAVIHRDGGHHTINAGMERSIADAAQEIHRLRADAEKWIAIDAELRAGFAAIRSEIERGIEEGNLPKRG